MKLILIKKKSVLITNNSRYFNKRNRKNRRFELKGRDKNDKYGNKKKKLQKCFRTIVTFIIDTPALLLTIYLFIKTASYKTPYILLIAI